MKRVVSTLLCLCLCTAVALAIRNESFINVIEGTASNMPPRYVMPLLSNGNLSIRFDTRGTQMVVPTYTADNGILWQGRRVGPPRDALFSFGHLKEEIACGGRDLMLPDARRLAARLDSLGVDHELLVDKDAGHSWPLGGGSASAGFRARLVRQVHEAERPRLGA